MQERVEVLEQLSDVELLEDKLELACFQLRQVQQVVDQTQQLFCGSVNWAEEPQ